MDGLLNKIFSPLLKTRVIEAARAMELMVIQQCLALVTAVAQCLASPVNPEPPNRGQKNGIGPKTQPKSADYSGDRTSVIYRMQGGAC